jgi:hypothetical protein
MTTHTLDPHISSAIALPFAICPRMLQNCAFRYFGPDRGATGGPRSAGERYQQATALFHSQKAVPCQADANAAQGELKTALAGGRLVL